MSAPTSTTRPKTRKRARGYLGAWFSVLILAAIMFAPVIAPHPYTTMYDGKALNRPSQEFLLGTDQFGRDILSRLLVGMRISVITSAAGVLLGALAGTSIGFLAGYKGGLLDTVVMRVVDTMFAFPTILLGIVTAAIMSPGLDSLIVAIIVMNIPVYARLGRSGVLAERGKEYVESSKALGASEVRTLFRHILPNTLPLLIVQGALALAHAMLMEAGLSFLGLGVQPPTPSLGSLLGSAREYIYRAPWYSIFPGVALSLLVLGMNRIADLSGRWLGYTESEG